MNIALDVMSGDNAPFSNIEGAIDYLNHYDKDASNIIFVGDENILNNFLKKHDHLKNKFTIKGTTEVVEMDEKPTKILRSKPNSSLVQSIRLLKDKKAHATVSSGNTGALLTTSLLLIGKIPGINRPALAPFIPTLNGGFIICDAGANVDTKPHHLVQFALMASAYMKLMKKRHNPKVALLNIGSEEGKGNELCNLSYPLLKKYVPNFIGNLESRYILEGKADIIVCDGFSGNIVLKLTEGVIKHLLSWINHDFNKKNINDSSKSIFDNIIQNITNTLDHEEHGAIPLLGVNEIIMKCHGSSTSKGIKNSLEKAQLIYKNHFIKNIKQKLSKQMDLV
tara:strand:+ start:461 stop:1471 length:1011 start_codon:yes stop_codon:yes gene_type:complete